MLSQKCVYDNMARLLRSLNLRRDSKLGKQPHLPSMASHEFLNKFCTIVAADKSFLKAQNS